jgi:FMN reductase [NAD(P)H]
MKKLKRQDLKTIFENRASIRKFNENIKIAEEEIKEIMKLAQKSANSINGQQISLVYTGDKKIIDQIATSSANQEQIRTAQYFICVVADYNRIAKTFEISGEKLEIDQKVEGMLTVGVDAGIMVQSLQLLTNYYGYGSTIIGAIRQNPDKIIDILNLPDKVYPLVGITIGVTDEETKVVPRPRVSFDAFAFKDQYDETITKQAIIDYDKQLARWWKDNYNMTTHSSYVESITKMYSKDIQPNNLKNMHKQNLFNKISEKE